MKYSLDQLMPKRLSEIKNDLHNSAFYWEYSEQGLPNSYWNMAIWNGLFYSTIYSDEKIEWVINIPGAPEEVRPRKYPDEKPEKEGKYIAHNKYSDEWAKYEYFRNRWYLTDSSMSVWVDIDYFIPIPLEEEMEEPTGKLDKIMSLEAKYAIGGAIKYTRNAMTTPLDDEQIADFAARFMAPYCNGYDFDITKRAPEIAPCPNPECGDIPELVQTSGNDDGKNFYLYCNSCGYCSPCGYDENDAVRLHNLIAGKSSKC